MNVSYFGHVTRHVIKLYVKALKEDNEIHVQRKYYPVLGNLEKDIGDHPYFRTHP